MFDVYILYCKIYPKSPQIISNQKWIKQIITFNNLRDTLIIKDVEWANAFIKLKNWVIKGWNIKIKIKTSWIVSTIIDFVVNSIRILKWQKFKINLSSTKLYVKSKEKQEKEAEKPKNDKTQKIN